jgi:serine/threonine protein kinase
MAAPTTTEQFLELVCKSGLVEASALNNYLASQTAAGALPADPSQLARALVRDGLLTRFQAEQLLTGKTKGFVLAGKYKLLEHLGSGGMGSVYLCEHISMRRRVAIKVLPIAHAKDQSYLERFYREARAVAALDHPNIVRAHDIDHDGNLHFLVMEYVDGASLQEIVSRHGPLSVARAANYISQAAWGLQHAHEAGLVHRDIKPGNILVDRSGTVKVLDMGLARFFHDDDNLSKRFDETVLGTSDYLAPEQTLDSNVDIRADIYSLGATFYFCLTGQTLFGEGKVAQKLIWHQTRQPKPIRSLRPEVPEELAALIEQKMLAKDPAARFQRPAEVCAALAPWTAEPIPPPPEAEMPRLSPAAAGSRPGETRSGPASSGPSLTRPWTVAGTAVVRANASPSPLPTSAAPTAIQPQAALDTPANGNAPPTVVPQRRKSGPSPPSSARRRPASSSARRRPAPPQPHRPVATTLAVLLSLLALVGAATWWAYTYGPLKPAPKLPPQLVNPGPGGPPQRAPAPPREASIMPGPDGQHINAPAYQAVVGKDGNLSSLRIGNIEYLKTDFSFGGSRVARGSYFFLDNPQEHLGVVPLTKIERSQKSKFILSAKGDRFAVEYDFGPSKITLHLNNATDYTVPFFLIFSPAAAVIENEQGQVFKPPASVKWAKEWKTTSWLAGQQMLTVTGGDRVWGPFGPGARVWQADVPSYGSRTVVLTMGREAEAARVAVALAAASAHEVRKPAYQATVAEDGCLTSLKGHGIEFLRPGVDVSRGLYFYNGKTLRLPELQEPVKDAITAEGPEAAIRYDFGPDAITCTAQNKTDRPMAFYAVFDPAVVAVRDAEDNWFKTPTTPPPDKAPAGKRWATTTWFADGGVKLTIRGGDRIWGPWSAAQLQVWEASLKPHEKRKITLSIGLASDAELQKVGVVIGQPAARADLLLQSPREYQVFQRKGRLDGVIHLRGQVRPECDRAEVRLTGPSLIGPLPGDWQPLPLGPKDRTFDQKVPIRAGGWYKLEVRALKGDKVAVQATVDHVGVGEVFVGAGQSNSTNCGPERLKQTSGMVSTFDGRSWRLADDPQPGVHDKSQGGSYWPAFGDALYARFKVPIGIASTGHSGTSVHQWTPGGELYRWMMGRIKELGPHGFRALLWHQGESDVNLSADEYADKLGKIIRASHNDAGWDFPWFVAQVSYHNPEHPSFPGVRAGQKKLWDEGLALEGPDTDQLRGDNRDQGGRGIHFSAKGLRAHGRLWADKVGAYLERVLQK